jgi:hypothetical protein
MVMKLCQGIFWQSRILRQIGKLDEPVVVHFLKELCRDGETRGGAQNGVYAAVRAERRLTDPMLIFVNPVRHKGGREYFLAVETAADLTGEKLRAVLGGVLAGTYVVWLDNGHEKSVGL